MFSTTTFNCTSAIVECPSYMPERIRTEARTEIIDDATIRNLRNYTRVTFTNSDTAAFLIPVGPYSIRVHARPNGFSSKVNVIGIGERTAMRCTPSEMRAIAYGLLAAANWMDGRDTERSQSQRNPGTDGIATI
jgi:hypothetical protein